MNQEQILIGRIGSPWGIQGFNWVQLFTEDPNAAFSYRPWTLRRPHPVKKGQYLEGDIVVAKPKGKAQAKGWVCKLTPDATRNTADEHKGLEIWVPLAALPALPDGEVYHHQLPGCTVVNESGENFGIISGVMETGANDVLVVAATDASIDDQERLIPWLDQTVKNIDLDRRHVTVDWASDF